MRIDRRRGRLAIVLPALAGLSLLAGGLMLLPNDREILHAERRAQPVPTTSSLLVAPVAPRWCRLRIRRSRRRSPRPMQRRWPR
ncbi:hypothetical protein QP150_01045 [Sphingomonas sp. 22L2VL55-3]